MSSPRSALLPKDREECEIQQRHFAYGVGKGRIEPFPSRWGVACLLKQIYEAKQAMHDRADKKFFIEEKRSTPPKIKSRNEPQRPGLGGSKVHWLGRTRPEIETSRTTLFFTKSRQPLTKRIRSQCDFVSYVDRDACSSRARFTLTNGDDLPRRKPGPRLWTGCDFPGFDARHF